MPRVALRKWKEQFHQEKQADDELTAYIGLIQALLAQGKVADAKLEHGARRATCGKEPEFSRSTSD